MKLLFIILIVMIFLLLLSKNKEHYFSLFEKINDNEYKDKLLFLVKIQNNYYNLYNFNQTQYGKYKNYQDFIKDLTSIFDKKKIQDNNQLSIFIKDLYLHTGNILNNTLIRINNKSNECEKNKIYSYIFLNINGYFYLDGFYQFLKKIFKIYKKKNINELLSKNYFVLFKDIILIKQICNLNTKTGIPNKNINTNTKSKNILKNTLINKINLPDEIEIVLNRKLINNISFPDLSIKPNILLRNFDKTYLNSYLSSDKYNMDNTNFNYNIINNNNYNINNILVYVNNESNKILNINMFTIDKLLELLFIKYNTKINNKKINSDYIYSCDGKIYDNEKYKNNNLNYINKDKFFCKYTYNNFEYYGLFLKKAPKNFGMEQKKEYYQLICNDKLIGIFTEGCGRIPSNYITQLNNCNKKNIEDCEKNNDCINLNNDFFNCIPGTPNKFKKIDVLISEPENSNKRKLSKDLEQEISNINPTNMPYYIWFNEKIFDNELNIKKPDIQSINK